MSFASTVRTFTIALVVVTSAQTATAAQDARFIGRVVDPDGVPVADVSITLRNVDNGQVVEIKSDKDGRYFRRALTIGRYEITFTKDGYIPARDQRRLGSGQTRHDAVLEPMAAVPVDPTTSPEYLAAYEAFQAGEKARVIEILEPVIESQPDFVAGALLLARAHFELEHWKQAISGYERVLALKPDLPVAYLDLGTALVQTGDLERASRSFESALAMQPDDADINYNIGAIYVRADDVEEAIKYLRRATELDPDHALAHKALAFALVRSDDIDGAIQHLERYLAIDPEAPDAAEMRQLLEQLRQS